MQPTKINILKICLRLEIRQSGKILPNLVTVAARRPCRLTRMRGVKKIRVLVGGPHVPPFSLSIYLYSQQKTNLYFKRNSRTEAV